MEYLPKTKDPRVWRRTLLCSVAGLALPPGSSRGWAQDASAPPPGAAETMQLPVISVQGTGADTGYRVTQPTLPKLTEPLVNTPQTINTVSRQLLDDQGVTNFRDALRSVPGISLNAGEGGSQGDNLTIRGFSARNDLYLDGMRDFGSYYRDPFYLEGIQVLKGPASILFGRGSTGGAVEQDSKLPKLFPIYSGTMAVGSDQTRRATADVNQPLPELGEGAALRLNAMVHDNHFADRNNVRNDRFGLAPSLALGLGTPTRLTLSYLHQQEYDIPDYGFPWMYVGSAGKTPQIAHPAPLSPLQSNYYGFANGNFLQTIADVGTAKIEHDFNNALTVSDQFRYANYVRRFDITEPQLFTAASANGKGIAGVPLLIAGGTPLGALNVSRNQLIGNSVETFLANQLDTTARFATGFLDHTLRAGFEVDRETSDPNRNTTIAPYSQTPLLVPTPGDSIAATNTFPSSTTTTTAWTQSLYALDTIRLGEQWQVMGGLRWDRFDADYAQTTLANPVTGAGAGRTAFKQVDEMVSWRGALLYKPLPFGSVYFAAGTSFNPSAESLSLTVATANLPPEKNESFEVGTKWDLLDGRLAVSGALFRTEKTNMREPDPNNSLFNILAGTGLARGGEVQVTGHLTPSWEINAGYAYTYGVITKSPVVGPASDLGHALANTPRHSASLWTEYHLPWWHIEVGGGVNVVSSRFAAATPTTAGGVAFFKQVPGYFTLGTMVKYPFSDQVALQLNLYNLTDNRYYDQLHPAHVVPGAGRTAMLTLSYKY